MGERAVAERRHVPGRSPQRQAVAELRSQVGHTAPLDWLMTIAIFVCLLMAIVIYSVKSQCAKEG
jgi:hypothetical protein